MRTRSLFAVLASLMALLGGVAVAQPSAAADPPELPPEYQTHSSPLYNNPAHWLCRPGVVGDACDVNLDTTVVNADGSLAIEKHEADDTAPIDCFYVYPTISSDSTVNSDFRPDAPEKNIAGIQAARLNSACRVYAPVYRQRTLSGLFGGAKPNPPGRGPEVAYSDVLDAFRMYVANYSQGRGFVLVGHSQGSGVLKQLIEEEIDKTPALRDRLVSALLIGSSVAVPAGEDVGGDFDNIPLCRKTGQIGCVISYASFRATAPPPSDSFFGRPVTYGSDGPEAVPGQSACNNPAALGGSAAPLNAYFRTESVQALIDPVANEKIKTEWVTFPDLLRGQCVNIGGFSYLRVRVMGDPTDARLDNIPGDLTPMWGMHLVDVNLTMGNLEAEVAAQAKTYQAQG